MRFTEVEADEPVARDNDSDEADVQDDQQGEIQPIEGCFNAKRDAERIGMEIVDVEQWQRGEQKADQPAE